MKIHDIEIVFQDKINSGNTFSNQYQKKLVKFRYNEHILRKKYDSDKIG
jgi:hypothetical protein